MGGWLLSVGAARATSRVALPSGRAKAPRERESKPTLATARARALAAALSRMSFLVRAAREEVESGQYLVVSDEAALAVDREHGTLTLGERGGGRLQPPLLHTPLRSCKLGMSETKLMIVPDNRGPCWLLEFAERSMRNGALALLRESHAADLTLWSPESDEQRLAQQIDEAAGSPEFSAYLARVQDALDRRASMGLGDLREVINAL